MNKIRKNKNFSWLFSILVISVLCAMGLFTFMFFTGAVFIKNKTVDPAYITKKNEEGVSRLQQYIIDHDISTYELDEIDDYLYDKDALLILYDENGSVMYDSSYSIDVVNRERENIKARRMFDGSYRPFYTIEFKDRVLNADYIYFYNVRLRFLVLVSTLFICFLIALFGITINFIRMVRYYDILTDDINKIIDGDVNHKITLIKGRGGISSFVEILEKMRVSIIEQGKKENALIESSQQFVMSMSHDLRTPLTILIGYLEILSGKKYKNDEIKEMYINKCRDKAYQIKELSDKLFQYFLTFNLREDTLHRETYHQSVIDELIGDYVFTLQEKGYNVKYSFDEGKGCSINMDIFYIRRVVDNLFSNITKYADISKAVSIDIFNNGRELILCFSNSIKQGLAEVESTNIGLLSSKKFIEEHGGDFNVEKIDDKFKVTVKLPVTIENKA